MVDKILPHLPPHETYVEPFGGAASLLLQKRCSPVEVYNDLDERLASLFRVLRDRETREALVEAMVFTLYSEREYDRAFEGMRSADPIEAARCFLVRAWMSVGMTGTKAARGFRRYSRADKRVADEWSRLPLRIRAVGERFAGVIVECADAVEVMQRHDHADALHYVDPPYVHATRGKNRYVLDLDDTGHERLLDALHGLSGAVVLSGYDNDLYRERLSDWQRVSFSARADDGTARTECLWLNHKAAAARPSLFDAPAEVVAE